MPLDDIHHTYLGVVREERPPLAPLTQMFCDDQPLESGDTKVAFDRLDMDQGLAPLAHWELDGEPLEEQNDEFIEVEPGYVQIDAPLNPKRLFRRMPGEELNAPASAQERRDFWITREMLRRENRRVRLIEHMVTSMITVGMVTLESRRFKRRVLDFKRKGSLMQTLAGPLLWDQSDVNPLRDLENWGNNIVDETGVTPTTVIMGLNAWYAFAEAGPVKEILDIRRGSAAAAELGPVSQDGLTFRGRFGTFDIYTAAHGYKAEQGGPLTRYFPANGVSISDPAAVMGKVAYGAIIHEETQDEPVAGEMFHYPYKSKEGKFLNLYSASAPIVFPMEPDATFYATVL